MTQYPPGRGDSGQYPQHPPQYVPAYATPPVALAARPTSVTVLAIIGIILGAMGTLCSPVALIPFLVESPGPKNPVVEAMKGDATLMGWTLASTVLGWLVAVVLLAASIAALKLKEWARKALLVYAVYALVASVLSLVLSAVLFNPKISAAIGNNAAARSAMFMNTVTTVGASIVSLVFPGFLLFYMTRPHVKVAFAGQPPAAAPPYGQYPPPGA